jgi:hypothetical protein
LPSVKRDKPKTDIEAQREARSCVVFGVEYRTFQRMSTYRGCTILHFAVILLLVAFVPLAAFRIRAPISLLSDSPNSGATMHLHEVPRPHLYTAILSDRTFSRLVSVRDRIARFQSAETRAPSSSFGGSPPVNCKE